MNDAQVAELLLQALETEIGGTKVYEAAIECAVNDDLAEEFGKYLSQTRHHVEVVTALLEELGIDPAQKSPGRQVAHHIGQSLVKAMEHARAAGPPEAAQLVAAECVTFAETKDHMNWELIGEVAGKLRGNRAEALSAAYKEVEGDEDEHLYHSTGWARELWMQSLGLPAVLPPPEERKDVKTAIGAARAKNAREAELG
jgi:rubrerythrin